ncbi:MAG TPA: hypothetical protein ENI62_08815 [Gammaproteobacteria bacterium]|nr:hypothetical protein [Gammaproteobacteria bacterium]
MRKILAILCSSLLLFTASLLAAELPAKDAVILKDAGIPLYKNAEFLNGGLGDQSIGARFASSANVEAVRKFYRSRFPSWALNAQYGTWILYDGQPGNSLAAYMGKKQIMVQTNSNLPAWFGVDKKNTTEILIVIPK